jgi:hypothetical protein
MTNPHPAGVRGVVATASRSSLQRARMHVAYFILVLGAIANESANAGSVSLSAWFQRIACDGDHMVDRSWRRTIAQLAFI